MLEHYTKINWSYWKCSIDHEGLIFIDIPAAHMSECRPRFVYGVTVKDCMNTYLCVVMGVKPRFPVV